MAVEKNVSDFVHIVFGYAESGALRGAFRNQKPTILCFDDDLSIGPITNLDSKVGSNTRQKWFRELYKNSELEGCHLFAKEEWIKNFGILKKSKQPILIWAGKTAKHHIWLRRILSYLPEISKKFMAKSERFFNVGTVHKMFSRKKAIPAKSKIRSKKEWKILQKSSTLLRRIDSKRKIFSVEADFFDQKILSLSIFTSLPNQYIHAAKVIGDLIGELDFDCNEEFLKWRLQELAKMGWLKSTQKVPLQYKNWKVKISYSLH